MFGFFLAPGECPEGVQIHPPVRGREMSVFGRCNVRGNGHGNSKSGAQKAFKKWSQRKTKTTFEMQNFTFCNFTLHEIFPIFHRYGDTTPFIRTFLTSNNFWPPYPIQKVVPDQI